MFAASNAVLTITVPTQKTKVTKPKIIIISSLIPGLAFFTVYPNLVTFASWVVTNWFKIITALSTISIKPM